MPLALTSTKLLLDGGGAANIGIITLFATGDCCCCTGNVLTLLGSFGTNPSSLVLVEDSERSIVGFLGMGGAGLRVIECWDDTEGLRGRRGGCGSEIGSSRRVCWVEEALEVGAAAAWCAGQTGGSFRDPAIAFLSKFSLRGAVAVEVLRSRTESERGGGGLGRGTLTQSGSVVALKGLGARWGLRTYPSPGGLTFERAAVPLSSHHLRLSELAGGRPGSIDS
jgi:hypothetical protein